LLATQVRFAHLLRSQGDNKGIHQKGYTALDQKSEYF
jgi:hypothetical protein